MADNHKNSVEYTITPTVIIGMMTNSKHPNKFKINCAAASALYQCEYFSFTPDDINFDTKEIKGITYQNMQWITKTYSYTGEIDTIYDRIRQRGTKKYTKVYDELSHIPFTHSAYKGSLNKIDVYNKFYDEGTLREHIIPYKTYRTYEDVLDYLNKYEKIIIKPKIGYMGTGLYFIQHSKNDVTIRFKGNEQKMTIDDLPEWLNEVVGSHPYIIQKYITSRTFDNHPFDIRVLLMKNLKNQWEFVVIAPRIGIEYEKITSLGEGGYLGVWGGFIEKNYGKDKVRSMTKDIKSLSLNAVNIFEKTFRNDIAEMAIDIAISNEGNMYLLELNMQRPGFVYYGFDVARAAIGYARYIGLENKKSHI